MNNPIEVPRTPAPEPEEYVGEVDEKAFRELRPYLFRLAKSYGASPDEADDLIQDTYVNALVSKDQFQPGTSIRAWLSVILRRNFLMSKRRDKWWVKGGDPAKLFDSLKSWPTQESELNVQDVLKLMDKLSPQHREIVRLIGFEERDYKEAAAELGVAVGTVKSAANRARKAFADILLEAGYIGSDNPIVVRFLDLEPKVD